MWESSWRDCSEQISLIASNACNSFAPIQLSSYSASIAKTRLAASSMRATVFRCRPTLSLCCSQLAKPQQYYRMYTVASGGDGPAAVGTAAPPKVRSYPDEPRVGVGVVILRQLKPDNDAAEVLLIRRAKEPAKGELRPALPGSCRASAHTCPTGCCGSTQASGASVAAVWS